MSQRNAHEALVEKVAVGMAQSWRAPFWDDLPETARDVWRKHARAVLAIVAEAAKEPTAEMFRGGQSIVRRQGGDSANRTVDAEAVWRAMLAASPLTPGDGG